MSTQKLLSDYEAALHDLVKSNKSSVEEYTSMSEAKFRTYHHRSGAPSQQEMIQYFIGQNNDIQSFYANEHIRSQVEPIYLNQNIFNGNTVAAGVVRKFLSADSGKRKSKLWIYQNSVYCVDGNDTEEEQRLLVLDFVDKERQKFERLKAKFSNEQSEQVKYERTRIPESVRIEVWRRDQGKCAGCGSREKLEYDHIVPVSRGGSNTARNVELLCEDCNRTKGNRIQ